jgi:hypothetical protein
MIRSLLIAALTVAAGCSAAAHPNELAGAPQAAAAHEGALADLDCDVIATPTRNGVRIEALAHAANGFGLVAYDLTVTKDGAGGSSDIVQSGEVDLIDGETVTLGVAEFNLGHRDRVRADLVLTDADGVVCRAELNS